MNRSRLAITLVPILLALTIFLLYSTSKNQSSSISILLDQKHRGVCWVGGPREIGETDFDLLVQHNVNWISQTPFGWQHGYDNPEIGTNRDLVARGQSAWWGEGDDGIRLTTQMARASGINTILKPHIWLNDKDGKWRGEINMKSEEDWKKWFEEYTDFMVHYAKLAEEEKIEMLCIGTELHQTCVNRADDWRKLIIEVRKVYSGPLTYAANFSEEYKDVSFWDDLDFIGIQAYFPLTKNETPTLEEIQKGWQKPIKDLSKFSAKHQKPILFTEVGYKSTKDSGIEPWKWPQRQEVEERKSIYSEDTQTKLYEALFSEVWNQPWMAGFHFWKWYPGHGGNRSSNASSFNIDFTPQNKEAESVMAKWFNKAKK